jgi:hypothetical protein
MEENAKTLIGSYAYSRLMLMFRVDHAALQARLPKPWEVAPIAERIWKDVNLAVGFCDVIMIQDAAGNPAPIPSNRYIPFNGPARNPVTGEVANMWYSILAVHPEALVGWGQAPHNPALTATFLTAVTAEGDDLKTTVTERFDVRVATGGRIDLEVEYQRGVPKPRTWQSDIRSPANPSYVLHYKTDELLDHLRSTPDDIDHVRHYRCRFMVPELADLFDGSEELVAITSVPRSVRHVFK